MSETKLPSIPGLIGEIPKQVRDILASLKEIIEVRDGRRGDQLDRFVTLRELSDEGVVNTVIRSGRKSVSNPFWKTTDTTPPPAITGFEVTGAYASMILTWNALTYGNHSHTEIWRSTSDALGSAIQIGDAAGAIYSDACGTNKTYYYWVRAVSEAGVVGPFNAVEGTKGETTPDVPYLLEQLTGKITESQLYTDLGRRIDLIDAPEGLSDSVNNRIASLRNTVVPRVDVLSTRVEVLESTDTLVNRKLEEIISVNAGQTSDIYLEQQARVSADAAQAIQIESVRATSEAGLAAANSRINVLETRDVLLAEKIDQIVVTNSNQTSDIYIEQQARIAGDSVNASLIESVRSTSNSQIADVTRRVETLESYDTTLAKRVDEIIVINSGQTSDIYLEQQARLAADAAQANQILQLSAQITGVDAALGEERVVRATADTAQTLRIDAAIARVDTAEATIASNYTTLASADTAQVSGINQLTARLNNIGGVSMESKFTAQASSITGLQGQYTVKIDSSGYVSGFGLASSTPVDGNPFSEFYVRADRFAVGYPSNTKIIPFTVTSGETVNGVTVPAGVYMDAAYIKDGTITNTKIGNAAIDDAKISSLSAAKITAGTIAAARLDSSVITSKALYTDLGVAKEAIIDSAMIVSAAITEAKIGTGAITTAKIEDAAITGAKIADAEITGAKIAIASITNAHIADAEITTAKIANANITTATIAGDAVSAIMSGSVTVDLDELIDGLYVGGFEIPQFSAFAASGTLSAIVSVQILGTFSSGSRCEAYLFNAWLPSIFGYGSSKDGMYTTGAAPSTMILVHTENCFPVTAADQFYVEAKVQNVSPPSGSLYAQAKISYTLFKRYR